MVHIMSSVLTSEMPKVVRREMLRTAFQLTADEIQAANQESIVGIQTAVEPPGVVCRAGWVVLWGNAEIVDYMGLEELSKDDPRPHLFKWKVASGKDGFRRWAAKNNGTNRALNDTNWQSLLEFMVHQRWGLTGEPLLRTADRKVLSAQHRLTAAFVATLLNPSLKFHFVVIDGIAECLGDFIDTGKSRDLKDTSSRHQDAFLPADTLRTLNDSPYLASVNDARKGIISDIKTATSLVWLRGRGSDINGSTTEYKADKSQYFDMLSRFAAMTFTDANGQEVESTTLERAAMRIYAWDREQGGVIQKYFGRAKLLAAIILASNIDNPSDMRIEKIDNREKKLVTYPDSLEIDFDLLEGFCSVAKDKLGPFAPHYGDTTKKTLDQITKWTVLKFGALVNIVKHFSDTRSTYPIAASHNEAGEIIKPASEGVTCAPLPGNMIPRLPAKRADAKTGVLKMPAFNYPHFSGLDVGLVDKDELKTNQVLEQVQEEYAEEQPVE